VRIRPAPKSPHSESPGRGWLEECWQSSIEVWMVTRVLNHSVCVMYANNTVTWRGTQNAG
jgi:hypothetical protein